MTAQQFLPVVESSQVSAARYAAQNLASAAGLSADDVSRIALLTTELATNLVKHTGVGGALLFGTSSGADGPAFEIMAIDKGPGIQNVEQALTDGYSTAGSLGGGLGAVRRLSDERDYYSAPGKGTVIALRIGARRRLGVSPQFEVGAVQVAMRGEHVCGDAWRAWNGDNQLTLAVADGLGHGPDAQRAASLFVDVLEHASVRSGAEAMQQTHLALRPTRGAAAAIAQFERGRAAVRFVGVGNISMVISDPGASRHAVSLGGTLGHEARTFREYTYPWAGPSSVAVMFSDGLTSHWSLDAYPGLRARTPAVIAAVLYRDYTRGRDDATVVVVKEVA